MLIVYDRCCWLVQAMRKKYSGRVISEEHHDESLDGRMETSEYTYPGQGWESCDINPPKGLSKLRQRVKQSVDLSKLST